MLVPVLGVAAFVAAEQLGWALPPVASSLGARVDELYYVVLAITGVTFIFTQLAIAFLVFFYDRPRLATVEGHQSDFIHTAAWLLVPLAGFIGLVIAFPMPNSARLIVGAALCVGWPLLFLLLASQRIARQRDRAAAVHGNTALEIIWTVVPTAIFVALFIYQYPVWSDYRYPRERPADAQEVRLIARQYEWRVLYPGQDGKLGTEDDLMVPSEVHTVKGRQIWIDLRSMDVLHGFFLPYHRIKQDVVPGLSIPVWFDSSRSTWENQSGVAMFKGKDITDPTGLATYLGGDQAAGLLKDRFASSKLNETSSAEQWVAMLNQMLDEDGTAALLDDDEVLPLDLRQLRAINPEGSLRQLLHRKVLDHLLGDYVRPVGGDFDILCTELCGPRHYMMKGRLVVHETQAQFDEWLAGQTSRTEVSP